VDGFLEPLLTIVGGGLIVIISFTKVQAETSYLRRELDELKRLLEKSEEKITNNFIEAKEKNSEINENRIVSNENTKKIEALFEKYNELRDRFDDYQKKNGNNK
jgi:hypothetical protein|tara:strand:+ start:181 stop:492 length:312 start_codon:yes stop_codon:yes gene_type:complete